MLEDQRSADSRCAVVTGAASGIGCAVSRTLAESGYKVALLDTDVEGGETLAQVLPAISEAAFFKCDVSRPEQARAAVEAVCARFGAIDLLVNNAGILGPSDLLTSSDLDLAAVMAVNLGGPLYMSKNCIQVMKARRGGQVINIASIAALRGAPEYPCYAASKAGLIALTMSLARKFGRHNIRVNCISPGSVGETNFLAKSRGTRITPDEKLRLLRGIPIGRTIMPEEVAELVLYMVSPRASGMNGANVVLDGGEALAP